MTRLTLELGVGTITVDGDDERDVIRAADFWQSLPTRCPICDAHLQVRYQKITAKSGQNFGKAFDYYRLRCKGPVKHETTLGQHQDGTGLFYREKGDWTTYTPGQHNGDDEQLEPAAGPAQPPAQRQAAAVPPPPPAAQADPERLAAGRQALDQQPCGLTLRATLTTSFGLLGSQHKAVADHALGRSLGHADWTSLTPEECKAIRDVAHQLQQGRLTLEAIGAA